ncbi:Glycoside hydrolase family 16 protein [Mycena venus]|uniref:Glycoside hydrolase family 16 protein n=1 Tax=Mycena venus TaxID=2733690 RepID=A0A8H6WSS9_9AGAR|nr:Glycoside hydrolase family 16 protein [Mycena venus]
MKDAVLSLFLSFAASSALARTYKRSEHIVGKDFFDAFDWLAISDPTHGRVNYTDEATAREFNLTVATHKKFILRSDDTTVLDPDGPGRNSVRLSGKNNYTTHVAVFDIVHMPQGCGTWPAVWEFGGIWPNGGETDILEGVNDQGPDQSTLHSGPNCTMPAVRKQTGTALLQDCNADENSSGCGVRLNQKTSYGVPFNANGGGWYAMERTEDFIRIWYWPRDDHRVPHDVLKGARKVRTHNWVGIPAADFPNDSCDLAEWAPHNIIINLTFCGDWAGAVYPDSGCPSTCIDYVNNNPSEFRDAFFEFNSINVYTLTGHPYSDDGTTGITSPAEAGNQIPLH